MIYIKKIKYFIIPILLIISYEVLTNSKEILESVNFSFSIWTNNIFPSLFPFFILSSLLINYGFVEVTSELFKPLMNLFGVSNKCAFIFIMSIVSGFPSNAKYTRELYLNKEINRNDASKILMFTHYSNPLFLLGSLSINFLNNKEAGLLILIIHYLSNIIIALLFRNYNKCSNNKNININNSIKNMINKINKSESFGYVLTNSIENTITTLLTILGTVSVFLVITTIINQNIHLNNFYQSILNGVFELTQGLKYVSLLNIPLKLKTIICGMLISFGGLSVHMQVISILSDTDINYKYFFVARIIHSLLTGLLIFLLFDIWIDIV